MTTKDFDQHVAERGLTPTEFTIKMNPKKIIVYLRKNTWKQLTFNTRIILLTCFSAIDTPAAWFMFLVPHPHLQFHENIFNFYRTIWWCILCGGINILGQGLNKIDSFSIAAIIFYCILSLTFSSIQFKNNNVDIKKISKCKKIKISGICVAIRHWWIKEKLPLFWYVHLRSFEIPIIFIC